jgi:regulatory protein
MPVITSIKLQKNKKRVNIYLDGKFGFGLDLETFVKAKLKVEQELTKSEVKKIVKGSEYRKTLEKLLKFATLRPRSGYEFKRWFAKHRVHETIRGDLLGKLEKLELMDDEKFAKWWVGQRLHFKKKSVRALKAELWQKRISKEIIEEVLSEVEVDELSAARALIEKNKYKWQKLGKFKARQKASSYLARKGFGWDMIKKALEVLDNQ